MSWYYNTESGALTSSGAVQSLFQDIQSAVGASAGWHKLNIPATATEAQAAAEAHKEFPKGTTPTTSVQTQVSNEASQIATGSATGLSGLSSIGNFFSQLGQRNLWLRVAKVVAGVALVIMGAAQLGHAQNIVKGAVPG